MSTMKYDNERRFLKPTHFLELKRVSKFNLVLLYETKEMQIYLNMLVFKHVCICIH